ncbi:DENN domain-containing protein 5B [Myotis davidii]|uniref:DENN domain-containing protein 5B n=1 Tax=Myotis davidii TaxID=225400 RepID=L5LJE8_MYODS|nr:DENN domain-containing protein 5B [Myotis davidii]
MARMSGSSMVPSLGSGSSSATCHFAHYFVLCGIDIDSGLEPDKLVGKAGLQQRKGPLIPAGQAKRPQWCTNPCTKAQCTDSCTGGVPQPGSHSFWPRYAYCRRRSIAPPRRRERLAPLQLRLPAVYLHQVYELSEEHGRTDL